MEQTHQNLKINYSYIVENYNRICYNIKDAIAKYRNTGDEVEIMAVTKTVSPDAVNVAVGCGVTLLGENRVQEYLSKKDFYDKSAKVHFIGHLQTNKVKYIINDIKLFESVDSFKLASEINRQSEKNGIISDILIEVNIGEEDSKSGIKADSLEELINQVSELESIRIKGLMSIPPVDAEEGLYEKLQSIFIEYKGRSINNTDMKILSVGMSNDYQTAIKYGSNLIRIGSGLFGARK